MKKATISILLAVTMILSLFAVCAFADGEQEVLEFYHGYYQDESEWAAAQVMRDIYDEFAAQHADGPVTFKPIAVENRDEIVSAQVSGGKFPDVVDLGTLPQAAVSQGLVYDLKPFIDENGLQDAVGLNYTQNDIDGHIYTVHDQLNSRGIWYNSSILEAAGVSGDDLATWEGFGEVADKVNALGDGSYGYISGQGSFYMLNAYLAGSENGRAMIDSELTDDIINSDEFAEAFKAIAALDQANGSDHTTEDTGNLMADFNANGTVGVLNNGVWNASGIADELADVIEPANFPGNVAISAAGAGITVANGMSDAKTELALEFVEYMTSAEVQEKIFTGVQANPCNTTVDLNALAEGTGDPVTIKLAKACSLVNNADVTVKSIYDTWGADVYNSILTALMECSVSGTDIDARFAQLQQELTALIA